jgi:hypothetical protein
LNVNAQNNMALVLATFPEAWMRNGTKAVELANARTISLGTGTRALALPWLPPTPKPDDFPTPYKPPSALYSKPRSPAMQLSSRSMFACWDLTLSQFNVPNTLADPWSQCMT